MSTETTPTPRARQGERQRQALKAISKFTTEKQDWTVRDLAAELAISEQQARTLLATLMLHGLIAPRQVEVVKQLPVVTDAGEQLTRAA